MLVIEKKTKKSHEKIVEKTKSFFGEKGSGLVMTSEDKDRISFEGGGGYVTVKIAKDDTGKYRVEVETREWEHQVKQFMGKL